MLFSITACSQYGPNGHAGMKTPTPIAAATSIKIVESPIATIKPSHMPTPTTLARKTNIPTLPNTLTATSTWTPAPTLSPNDAVLLVRDLLENNGGCELPCWWGMVPGQTDWIQARHFFETFATSIVQGGEAQKEEDGQSIYSTNFSIHYKIAAEVESNFGVVVENEKIVAFATDGEDTRKAKRLDELLTNYGIPDYVWLHTYPYGPTTAPPTVDLIVYYPEKGFWAHFQLIGELKGDLLRACPQSAHPRLLLWPTREWTFDDLIQVTLGLYAPDAPKYPVLQIKDATSMDIEDFYNTFKNPDNQECIETPIDLWP